MSKRLVYFSNVSWNSFSQRAHMFAYWAYERHNAQVLWIEPYPIRFPRLNDWKRLKAASAQHHREKPLWLQTLRPKALPCEPLPGSSLVNGWMWSGVLQEIAQFTAEAESTIAIGKPSELVLQTLAYLPKLPSIYDAMDDVPEFFSGLAKTAIKRREQSIAQRVDQIWASSHTLQNKFSEYANKTQLILNACTHDNLPEPEAKHSICSSATTPILGYVGAIAKWFDWPWVIRLAQAAPWARLRLIGPMLSIPPEPLPSNIEILPACEHEVALRHMQSFDVGLIPFRVNTLTESVDPIKYYEYKAMGLPVISSRFGQMRMRKDDHHVFFVDQGTSIAQLLRSALACRIDKEQTKKFRQQNMWRLRFDAGHLAFG
jgi:glycosyltransferase involved in cell wall biosynthesis